MPLLTTYIEKFQDIRVLVIGDIMLDRFMYGKVERISPEAPAPVFKFHHEKKMLGGAGNVAQILHRWAYTAISSGLSAKMRLGGAFQVYFRLSTFTAIFCALPIIRQL